LFFSLVLLLCPSISALILNPTDWRYFRPVSLAGSGNPGSYQVAVLLDTHSLISAGKMRPDCGDARFTDSDKVSILPYWLESGCDTQAAVFWVKVPLSTFPKTIYVYYGRQSASSQSSGDDTFEFFDGFSGNSLDSSKWDSSNCATVSNSLLHLSKQGSGDCTLIKKGSIPGSGVLHLKCRRGQGESGEGPAFWTLYDDDFGAFFQGADHSTNKWGFINYQSQGAWEHDGNIDLNEHVYRISYSEGTIYYCYIDSTLLASGENYKPDPMSILLSAGEQGEKSDSYFDYFFITKFASPEPTYSLGPEENTQVTTTTVAPTTTFPSDICVNCCIAGDYSCTVSCQGIGINTIAGGAPITECIYDGLTIVIKRGSNTQTSDCVNGICAAATTTSSLVSSTTAPTTTTTIRVTTTTVSSTLASTSTTTYPTTTLMPTTRVSTTSFISTTESPSSTYPVSTTGGSTSTSYGPATSYAASTTTNPVSTQAVSSTIASTTLPIVSTTFGGATTIITTRSVSTTYPEAEVSTSLPPEELQIKESPLITSPDTLGEKTETDPDDSSYLDEWEKNISSMHKEPVEVGNKMLVPALVAFLVIITFLIMFLLSYYNKKHRHSELVKQCEESMQKVESLKVMKGSAMNDYRTRMVSEEEARRIVLDCERDIVFEKEKLHRLLRKLGIKHEKLQGKEEIIGWIMQKLSRGEDPELLKKGLLGMNADPALVDDVKAAIK